MSLAPSNPRALPRAQSLALLCALLMGTPAPALGGDRSLRKIPSADRAVRHIPPQQRAQMVSELGECAGRDLEGRDVGAYICKIRLLEWVASDINFPPTAPPELNPPLQRRLSLSLAAIDLGHAVSSFTPVNPARGLPQQQFQARALSCRPLGTLYEALLSLPAGSPAARALQDPPSAGRDREPRPLKDILCACTEDAARLGEAAAVGRESALGAEVSRALYRRGCYLDVGAGSTTLVELQRGQPRSVPAATTSPYARPPFAEQVRSYAANRDFQLNRCRRKYGGRGGHGVQRERIEACVCEVTEAWRPARSEGGPSDEVRITLIPDVADYLLTIDASGIVTMCHVEIRRRPGRAASRR